LPGWGGNRRRGDFHLLLFWIIRAVYWSKEPADLSPIHISTAMKICLGICIAAMLYLGFFLKPFSPARRKL